jgi:uncharacterized protein YbjT (DUF2867 family)
MRILLLGATGLIGRELLPALLTAGYSVTCAGRGAAPDGMTDWLSVDYRRDHCMGDWLPRLSGIDMVINSVGIFSETVEGEFNAVHHLAPRALFRACAQAGVRKVIHISALGARRDAPTCYWRSKAAGDEALRNSRLHWVILQPSLVFAPHGRSSRLFLMLASLPLIVLPAVQGRVQPIHIDDFRELIIRLLDHGAPERSDLAAVGPCACALPDYLTALRRGLGLTRQCRFFLSEYLSRLAAGLSSRIIPGSLLTPDSLTMLTTDNSADPTPVRKLLDRPLRMPETFVDRQLRPAAILLWWRPLARLVLAALWLWTAAVSLFGFPHAISQFWLMVCGIPPTLTFSVLIAASLMDATLGFLTLVQCGRWLWRTQATLIVGYTLVLTLCLPEFWFHPFGPLSKNLPILAVLLLLDVTEE